MAVVSFPAPSADAPAGGQSVAAAVGRFLDQVQAATTRAGYAVTLTRLTALAGPRSTAELASFARPGQSRRTTPSGLPLPPSSVLQR